MSFRGSHEAIGVRVPKLIIKQAGQSRDFPIVKESLSIGRTPENDI